MDIKAVKEAAVKELDNLSPALKELGKYLHNHPELSTREYLAVDCIKQFLTEQGFKFEKILSEKYDTSFWGRSGKPGLGIGFLAEYDALPELGHGCGHNLIAMSTVGAAVALNRVLHDKVETVVYGCAAEETVGAKIYMAEQDYFAPVKAALIVHPDDATTVGGTSYATHPLEFKFIGAEAHVADPEYHGINALDMMVDFYNRFKELQKTFVKPYIIGTMIVEAGKAPNIIPGRAIMRSTIRSLSTAYLEEEMLPQIKALARKVAAEHGGEVELRHYEELYKDLKSDKVMEDYYKDNFALLGEPYAVIPDDYADGSTDVGNVSHVTRTCQPTIGINACGCDKIYGHTREFAAATGSDLAYRKALVAAKAMVMTAIDIVGEEL